jgi:hypothetical protein
MLQVEQVNLAGLDRVIVAYAAGASERSLLLRQYRTAFKKSGTKVRCMRWLHVLAAAYAMDYHVLWYPSRLAAGTSMRCCRSWVARVPSCRMQCLHWVVCEAVMQ